MKTQTYKGVMVKSKTDSWLCRLLGKISPSFMQMWTTPWKTIYAPEYVNLNDDLRWYVAHIDSLDHELVHVDQQEKLTLLGFWLVWLLGGLPLGLCYGRYALEREAYMVQVSRATDKEAKIEWAADYIAGPAYGWAWPKSRVVAWFRKQL